MKNWANSYIGQTLIPCGSGDGHVDDDSFDDQDHCADDDSFDDQDHCADDDSFDDQYDRADDDGWQWLEHKWANSNRSNPPIRPL